MKREIEERERERRALPINSLVSVCGFGYSFLEIVCLADSFVRSWNSGHFFYRLNIGLFRGCGSYYR